MKYSILDSGILTSLRPMDLVGFMSSKGWERQSVRDGISQLWAKDGRFEVLLPTNRAIDGFAVRMLELLRTLERAEDMNQQQILNDLKSGAADTLRVELEDSDSLDGSVALDIGAALVAATKTIAWSAACSAVRPDPHYTKRRPPRANQFLRRARLAPSEIGSYVVRLLAPVAPSPQVDVSTIRDGVLLSEEPFERQVVSTVMTGLAAASDAAEAASTGELSALDQFVRRGLSVNMCKGLASIYEVADPLSQLKVSVSWSWRRPLAQASVPAAVEFGADKVEVIKEVGRILQEFSPREEFELIGTVVRLQRNDGELMGNAVVRSHIDRSPKNVNIQLPDDAYRTAINAHDNRSLISCLGDLERDGMTYVLRSPRAFRIISD